MLIIRPAASNDQAAITRILNEADLRYPSEAYDNFWLAEKAGQVVGVVRLEERPEFIFLTSLGVAQAALRQGVASALMTFAVNRSKKPIYLYTVIPAFFQKFGFVIVPQNPSSVSLPSKSPYGCDECFPNQCVTMVKQP
jgi:N-acetylglutamate synthase-like GNAT family acetyltransferase